MHPQYTAAQIAYFWSRVRVTTNPDACWDWAGTVHHEGYGVITIQGRQRGAHCVSYILTHGEPPPDRPYVLHKCPGGGRKICVNPLHLAAGTPKENSEDRERDGTVPRGKRNGHATHPESTLRGDQHPSHLHPELRSGERNGRAKLAATDARAIRQQFADGASKRALGRHYGVSATTIYWIIVGKHWSNA